MGQTNTLFVQHSLDGCSLSSAPTNQHVKPNLTLAMIKNLCSNATDMSLLIKLATNMDEGHGSMDDFWSLQNKDCKMILICSKFCSHSDTRSWKWEVPWTQTTKNWYNGQILSLFSCLGAENRMLQSLPALADKRTQTDDALDDFWISGRYTFKLFCFLLRKEKQAEAVGKIGSGSK